MQPRFFALLVAVPAFSACSTVYPEIATPVHPGAGQASISPAPPPDLFFVNFEGARIPERTRDGRQWDRLGGSAPDPFAIFFLNDGELFRTPVQSNTLEPTWPDQKHANYRIPETAKVRIEVWDSNPINNHPICVKELRRVASEAIEGRIEIECSSGAHVNMIFEAARPLLGLGFYYELRTQAVTEKIQDTSQFGKVRHDVARLLTERSARRRLVLAETSRKERP